MIITEIYENNPDLVRRYSDAGFMIRQIETGNEYAEAIDLITAPWTYEETDIPINLPEQEQEQEPDIELTNAEAFDIIFGGEY